MSKTTFGGKDINFTPFADGTNAKAPTYNFAKRTNIGALQEIAPTVNFAEASQYGDNQRTKYRAAFQNASYAVTVDGVGEDVEENVLGKTVDEDGVVISKTGDNPPYGALTYYKTLMDDNGAIIFQGWFHPMAKAKPAASGVKTVGENFEFQNEQMTFEVFAIGDGTWEKHCDFDDEEDCQDWLAELCGYTAVSGG